MQIAIVKLHVKQYTIECIHVTESACTWADSMSYQLGAKPLLLTAGKLFGWIVR